MEEPKKDDQTFTLSAGSELRVQVDKDEQVICTVTQGLAEIFGAEMAVGKDYVFYGGSKFAIFTWFDAVIRVQGECISKYTVTETPMDSYLAFHTLLQKKRTEAQESNKKGPVCLVCGPVDVGKSTLCTILCNYALRKDGHPLFVELDVGQGGLTIPGTIGAAEITRPITFEDGLDLFEPIIFYYGGVSLDHNRHYLKTIMRRLTDVLKQRQEKSPKAQSAGMIINYCGWVTKFGLAFLLDCIKEFEVDTIAVLAHDELAAHLSTKIDSNEVSLVKLHSSGGVVSRERRERISARNSRIYTYFYGSPNRVLRPHEKIVDARDVFLFKVGAAVQAPKSALPLGSESKLDPILPRAVFPENENIRNKILAVSTAKSEEELLTANVAGFVHIRQVTIDRNTHETKLKLLVPSPGPLPGKYLLVGELDWAENS